MIEQLNDIAKEAGARILKHYERPYDGHQRKGDGSPLTAADLEANDFILASLRDLAPGVPAISEEVPAPPYEQRREWKSFWLVDPLDGTKEFLEKNGEFTVNIALVENGVPVLGVIYAPAKALLYFGEQGKGAWKVEGAGLPVRIHSREPDPRGPVVIVESRRHGASELDAFLKAWQVERRVPAGSSLKFCLVAEGQADLYPRLGPTMEWDVAAGDCIYRNSGSQGPRVTSLRYNKLELRNGPFVIGLTSLLAAARC